MTSTTHAVSEFICRTNYDDLPALARNRAKDALSDYLACAAAGVTQPTSRRIINHVSAGAGGTCSVVGTDLAISARDAALANGTIGHALDYDDISWSMNGHAGVAILPAVLALAEQLGKSGRDVISAYVVGFEIAAQLGRLLNRGHYEKGWHATGTLGTMGAAAAAANVLGLGPDETAATLGIAASMASGIRQNFGTDTKPLHAGRAAQNGVAAAQLAGAGFTADPAILESQWGFCTLYSGATPYDPATLAAAVGQPLDIVANGFQTKFYPSCGSTHPAIDAALALRAEHSLTPGDVTHVDAGVVDLSAKILIHHDPQTGLQGKFSIEYVVARALLSGAVVMDDFADSRVAEPAVRDLMRRVNMRIEPRISDAWVAGHPRPVELTITLATGEVLRRLVETPTGSPGNELSAEQRRQKFTDCAQPLVGRDGARECLQIMDRLETVDNIRELTRQFGRVAAEPMSGRNS